MKNSKTDDTLKNNRSKTLTKVKCEDCPGATEVSKTSAGTHTLLTQNVYEPSEAANNNQSCSTNCFYLVKEEVLNGIPDNGCKQTFIYSKLGVLPTNLIRSPENNDNKEIKSLSLVQFCPETGGSRELTVINIPARSNYSPQCDSCPKLDKEFLTLKIDNLKISEQCVVKDGKTFSCEKEDGLVCRICHSLTAHDDDPLISPCLCTGSMKYVHESCLMNWLRSSVKTNCELCLHQLRVRKFLKPLNKWRLPGEKPLAIIWLLTFFIALTLNVASITKDASRSCSSTPCIVFYVLGATGVILGIIFLGFWAMKSAVYFKKWLAFNQVWLLEEKYFEASDTPINKNTLLTNV